MLQKRIVPQAQDFGGQSPIEILKIGSKGLDKTASMQKRASAFQLQIAKLKPMPKKAYLHVITTGAWEHFGPNRNCFPAGTKVTTKDGYKNIQDIVVGDLVMTGSGQLHKVAKTINREYTGDLYTIKARGEQPVTMTADHPVRVIRRADYPDSNLTSQAYREELDKKHRENKFVQANTLREYDIVMVPGQVDSSPETPGVSYNGWTYKYIEWITRSTPQQPVIVYNLEIEQDHTFCVPFVVHNCDAWNEDSFVYRPPMPKNASCKEIKLDGGLRKYHDTYMLKDAGVYQEHDTKAEKSGIVKAARYNEEMHRGELLIQVDTDKWAERLNKKASGQDIYLSVGASLVRDVCASCGHQAHTLDEHCQHIKKQAGMVLSDGTKVCMINDAPKFYDISGVNVPADQMAFVLRKIASGSSAASAIEAARFQVTRMPMPFNKAASILGKLAKIEKRLECKVADDDLFQDNDQAVQDFLKAVENYDSDQVIDQCHRHAILLSPKMLFRLIGKESDNAQAFNTFADKCPCCGSNLMQDMEQDQNFKPLLRDGSFDSVLPTDLNLSSIIQSFVPQFGVSRPAMNGRAIRITIMSGGEPKSLKPLEETLKGEDKPKDSKEEKQEEDIEKKASLVGDEFRRTYARYVMSFAQRNSDDTCELAMQKVARYK